MKAFLFYGPKDIRLEEVSRPELGDGEVLVKVEAALTGGTDTKTYLRGHPRIIKTIPSSFGYEFAGTVVETNNNDFQIGDRVVAANTAPCFKCFFCNKKEYELCENLDFLNGSFAEYIRIPAQIVKYNLYKIPHELSFKEAAMAQTLAVILHGLAKTEIKSGDTVVIYGLGPIGLSFIKVCKKLFSNLKIIAIGRSQSKLDLALANGADIVLNSSNANEGVKKATQGYGADKVIEVVGKPEAWLEALSLVRPGGTINFFGGCPKGTKIEIDTFQIHYQEIKILGTFHHSPNYIQEALELIASGKINMLDLISHEMPLSDLTKALEMMIDGKAMKILIKP